MYSFVLKVLIGAMYYLRSSLKRLELSFTGATVFFYVDLTGSFCCDFDLFGIATGQGPSPA